MGLAAYPLGVNNMFQLNYSALNPKLCFSHIIMSIDKSWIKLPNRLCDEYEKGIYNFIEYAKQFVNTAGSIRCPCRKCHNSGFIPFKTMTYHLRINGFYTDYMTWTYHGETPIRPSPVVVNEVRGRSDMNDVIEDLIGERMEEDTDLNDGNSDTETSDVNDEFEALIDEVESELYPGCTNFSSLDFTSKLMNMKVRNKWTNSSFDELLEFLQSVLPAGNKVPPSFYKAKKTLKKTGLGYEMIDVCKWDCALFWKEHQSLQNCPVCNESRWVNKNTNDKKVPHKVLRYFRLTPRLQRLYGSRHTTKDMIWHNTG